MSKIDETKSKQVKAKSKVGKDTAGFFFYHEGAASHERRINDMKELNKPNVDIYLPVKPL